MPARSRSRSEALPLVVAITGASGAPYAVRLLEVLVSAARPVWLVVSAHGWRLLETESAIADERALRRHVGAARWDSNVRVFDDGDRGAAPASGSTRTAGMIVCPCSMGTVAAIANGTSRSLIERAADVTLKERRRLIVVPRETPLSDIHLENLLRLSRAGATVLPAAPGYYN
ncbi:MAG: UbiX family flavin prenyltransferase, partial [Gemmatimonadaceae bacterium]